MRLLFAFVALLFVGIVSAQTPVSFEKKEYNFADGKVLPYRILYPENYDKTKKYPLVLFLHGAGERGDDNEKQLVHGSKLFLDKNKKINSIENCRFEVLEKNIGSKFSPF